MIWIYILCIFLKTMYDKIRHLWLWFLIDDDKCESCAEILEELETIDDDTDKHGIQFVKSNDAKLAAEIGVFSFPALVYYETGVPIMYDGKYGKFNFVFYYPSLSFPLSYNPRFS